MDGLLIVDTTRAGADREHVGRSSRCHFTASIRASPPYPSRASPASLGGFAAGSCPRSTAGDEPAAIPRGDARAAAGRLAGDRPDEDAAENCRPSPLVGPLWAYRPKRLIERARPKRQIEAMDDSDRQSSGDPRRPLLSETAMPRSNVRRLAGPTHLSRTADPAGATQAKHLRAPEQILLYAGRANSSKGHQGKRTAARSG